MQKRAPGWDSNPRGHCSEDKASVHETPTLPTELNDDLRMNHFHIKTYKHIEPMLKYTSPFNLLVEKRKKTYFKWHQSLQTVLRLSSFTTIQLRIMAFHPRDSTDQRNETEYLNAAFVSAQCARYSEESTRLTLNTIDYF